MTPPLNIQALIETPQGLFIAPYQPAPGQMLPYFGSSIPAGFPSPAADYLEERLDLNDLVIRHPAATFFVQVQGESMVGLRYAREGMAQTWYMRQGKRSQHYTTRWEELVVVAA